MKTATGYHDEVGAASLDAVDAQTFADLVQYNGLSDLEAKVRAELDSTPAIASITPTRCDLAPEPTPLARTSKPGRKLPPPQRVVELKISAAGIKKFLMVIVLAAIALMALQGLASAPIVPAQTGSGSSDVVVAPAPLVLAPAAGLPVTIDQSAPVVTQPQVGAPAVSPTATASDTKLTAPLALGISNAAPAAAGDAVTSPAPGPGTAPAPIEANLPTSPGPVDGGVTPTTPVTGNIPPVVPPVVSPPTAPEPPKAATPPATPTAPKADTPVVKPPTAPKPSANSTPVAPTSKTGTAGGPISDSGHGEKGEKLVTPVVDPSKAALDANAPVTVTFG